jgi:tRNA dimethylallyltransferase
MQVYAGLGALTGAASPEEQARLEHRLIGFLPVTRAFSVGEYMPLAHAEIDAALESGRRPIVVGGTGLYLRAALTELDLRPPPPADLRERIHDRMAEEGPDALHDEVLRRAPRAQIARGDRNRIIRYLELLEMGEDPLPGERLWTEATRHPTLMVGLVMDRDALGAKIGARMDAIARSAVDEVRAADAAGASLTARKALGFDDVLAGDLDALKLKTRQFARRQMTWMRKLPGVSLVDATARRPADVAAEVAKLLGG